MGFNKKGILLAEETLKIVIAIISIVFLVYLLVSLYLSQKDAKELEQANRALGHLVDVLYTKNIDIDISSGPNGWFILSWPYEGITPHSCSDYGWLNCICICKTTINSPQQAADKCDSKGVCMETKQKVVVMGFSDKQSPISIDNTIVSLKLQREANEIIIKKR